jgi:sortase A
MRTTAQIVGRAMVLTGALALLAFGWLTLLSIRAQREAGRELDRLVTGSRLGAGSIPPRGQPRRAIFGRLELPRLGLSVMVFEGATAGILQVGAGHVANAGAHTGRENIVVAAHRDTFFRPLRNIRRSDFIILTTPTGAARYMVVSTEIAAPSKIQVLHPTPDPELTLITCYPFYYVGPAPKRFIVHARRLTAAS